jgi:hypothetical protein
VLAYQAQTQELRGSLEGYVQRLWRSLGEYRAAQIGQFLRQTAAGIAVQKQITLGSRFLPAAVHPRRVTGAAARNGADPADVYERPFHLVWRQLHDLPREPASIDKAIAAGMNRAVELALDDLQLAKVKTAGEVLQRDRQVTGYRRVLEGAHSCGLCIVASTQRYHKDKLLPIHGGCDCGVAVIFGDQDPGQVIDPETLEGLHDRIAERFAAYSRGGRAIPSKGLPNHRDVLVTHQHGELGDVLAVRGAPFTGTADL